MLHHLCYVFIGRQLRVALAVRWHGANSKGQSTLVKAYKKDNRQFGGMMIKMKLPVLNIGGLKLSDGAKMIPDITFAGAQGRTGKGWSAPWPNLLRSATPK
jgi:hypothetical protein